MYTCRQTNFRTLIDYEDVFIGMLNFESKVSITSTLVMAGKKKYTTADTLRHTDTDMMGDYSMGSQTHTHTHTHTHAHAHMHTHISTLSLSSLSLL